MDLRSIAFAAALAVAAGQAGAAATAQIDGRTSVVDATYFGGFAIAYDGGEDGSLTPVTALEPAALAIAGSHTYDGAYQYWTVTYTVNWNLAQDWRVDPAARTIGGSGSVHLDQTSAVVGPNCAPCWATVQMTGRNNQALDFALDAGTPFQFHSDATTGQWVELQQWNEPAQRWFALWNGPLETQGKAFDRTGTLAAGLYRLQNNPYDFRSTGGPPASIDNAWSYVLTLPDAAVTAVPEPASAALLAAGAVLLLAWRRRER